MDGQTRSDDIERRIEDMVRRFYEIGNQDPVLGPVFRDAIHDWEAHYRVVADFWSGVLLGTERFKGNLFAPHMRLPIEPEDFDRWVDILRQAAAECLTPNLADLAVAKATHMSGCIKVGLFPWRGADGKPSRLPPT